MIARDLKLALYMEGSLDIDAGKMGHGVLRYSPNPISCVIDSQFAGRNARDVTGIPRDVPIVGTLAEAIQLGAHVLVLGIAPPGGLVPHAWYPDIDLAVADGLSIVNGLHDLLGPRYPNLKPGQWIWDIRVEPKGLDNGTGAAMKLGNRRVLMIGTDMSIGKMTAGLEMWRLARQRWLRAEFVATGQIGMTIMGCGVPLDAIRLDFASGAIEREVLRCSDAELIVVEGQGALIHPASSATLPLMRGSMPTHFVLCHRAGLSHLKRVPWVQIPPLKDYVGLYEDLSKACGPFPRARTAAVALDTRGLSEAEASAEIEKIERETGLSCTDPVRCGPEKLLDAVLAD